MTQTNPHSSSENTPGQSSVFAPQSRTNELPQRGPVIDRDTPLAIVGAGTIGRLIATEALLGGLPVYLVDRNPSAIEGATKTLRVNLAQEIKDSLALERTLGRLTTAVGDLASDEDIQDALGKARCVVEALPEIKELKEEILGSLDEIVPPHTPITTVSSSLPVSELLGKTKFPERFINSHPLQRGIAAIEIMPSALTSRETHENVTDLFNSIGMVPIQVQKETVGFIFNIVWRNIKKTALDLVERGVNTPADFDRIWMMAFKSKNAPFALMDMVGLDVVLAIEERYATLTGDPKDEPPTFLKEMVRQGNLGLKTGKGFYSYPNPAYKRLGFAEQGAIDEPTSFSPIRDTLIGSWELVSFSAIGANSKEVTYPMGSNAKGKLMYSQDGEMSVALVNSERNLFNSSDPLRGTVEERSEAFSEYFGYFGKFRYRDGIVYHDVEHCSFPNWSGCTLMRTVSIDENGLMTLATLPVEVAGSIGIQKLVWRRRG
jgi:3-hydroxybutyryl-CoA dehydrogenase